MSSADQIPQTIEQKHEAGFHESGTVTYCLHCAAARSGDALRGIVAQRDQLAAACDVFRGRIQALEMERDGARAAVQSACDVAVTAACAAVEAERDQAYSERDGAVDALLAMTAERDAARIEGARLREALKQYTRAYTNGDHAIEDPAIYIAAQAALSGSPSAAEWLAQHDAEVRAEAQHALLGNGHLVTKLRERVKTLECLLRRAVDDDRWDAQAEKDARAALSTPIADKGDGAPKPKCGEHSMAECASCGNGAECWSDGIVWTCLECVPCPACKEKP